MVIFCWATMAMFCWFPDSRSTANSPNLPSLSPLSLIKVSSLTPDLIEMGRAWGLDCHSSFPEGLRWRGQFGGGEWSGQSVPSDKISVRPSLSILTEHGPRPDWDKVKNIELLLRLWWEIVKSFNRKIVIILLIINSWASFTALRLKWAVKTNS